MPSCAMRSVMSILIACAASLCASAINPLSSLTVKTELPQALLQQIHRLYQVDLLEEAEVPHTDQLAFQVFLPTTKDNAVLLTQLLKQGLYIDAFWRQDCCDGVRCVLMIG